MHHAHTSQQSARLPITGSTKLVGVIGWPIAHSVSPAMHNAALAHLGLDWRYVAFPVAPESLPAAISGLAALGIRGINVAVPHKQAILVLMDVLTSAAQAIGAVNTVRVREGKLLGHNTDAAGFLRALTETGFDPQGCRALVLGAGGAARSVVYALATQGASISILNRTADRAHRLANDMAGVSAEARIEAGSLHTLAMRIKPVPDLIVNTTSLGMWPDVDSCAWPSLLGVPKGKLVFDLVYNPRATQLVRRAREAGAVAIDGLRMLVHQGAEALELWTGEPAPTEVMYNACTRILGGE